MEIISYKVVLAATAIGILPLVAWLFFIYKRSSLKTWGINFLIVIFFVGVLTAFPASLLEIFFTESDGGNIIGNAIRKFWFQTDSSLLSPDFLVLIAAAAIEEVSKGLGILYLCFKKRGTFTGGGIIIGILTGLSFAVTENGVYFATAINSQMENFFQVVLLRFILSTTAHIVYSGLMGYYLYRLLSKPEQKIKSLGGALIVPFLVHLVFNFLLGTAASWAVILIIFAGVFVLFKLYQKEKLLI